MHDVSLWRGSLRVGDVFTVNGSLVNHDVVCQRGYS